MTSSGGSPKGHKLSEETKQKISRARTGSKHPFYGKHHSEESKRKTSAAMVGIVRSEETKRRISQSKLGVNRGKNLYEELLSTYNDADSIIFIEEHKDDIYTWDDVSSDKDICNAELRYAEIDIENSIAASCDLCGDSFFERDNPHKIDDVVLKKLFKLK
jgi:hypothetical protein